MINNFPIIPVGMKLLIEMIDKPEEKSESGLTLVNSILAEGRVVAISSHLKGLYEVGDIVLYPDKKGMEEPVGGKVYKWLDATPEKEEIYGIKKSKTSQDKGDSL